VPDTAEKHYPSRRYHPKHGNVVVNDEAHEKEVAHPDQGWVTTPADFPPPPPVDPTVCSACGQKLPVAESPADSAKPAKPAKEK
jgi:hypothetical protein